MNLKCKITVKSTPEENILFTKDDENYKRWFSFVFKDTYFIKEV